MEKSALLQALAAVVAPSPVLSAPEDMLVYECDGHTLDKAPPSAVVFPTSAEQVAAIVKLANRHNLPFVARGAGTGLSGGALALDGGLVIEMSRMNKILELDYVNQRAVVEPGLVLDQLNAEDQYADEYPDMDEPWADVDLENCKIRIDQGNCIVHLFCKPVFNM